MTPHDVVSDASFLGERLGVACCDEPVLAQAFVAELPIEAPDLGAQEICTFSPRKPLIYNVRVGWRMCCNYMYVDANVIREQGVRVRLCLTGSIEPLPVSRYAAPSRTVAGKESQNCNAG